MKSLNIIAPIVLTMFVLWMNRYVNVNPLWYRHSKKPIFLPPKWVFPIIWTILYSCFIYSWIQAQSNLHYSVLVWCYIASLLMNGYWTFLFFELKQLYIAAFIIVCLIILHSIIYIYQHDIFHTLYTILHISWLSLAFFINLFIIQAN